MEKPISHDLENLISQGESETREFKESFGDEAMEAIGAFSNAPCGMLLIGVKDSGEICGTHVGKKTLEDITNRIMDATDPRVQPSTTKILHNDCAIIAIKVTASIGSPVSVRGRYFRRAGRTYQRMSHQEMQIQIISATQ